MESREKQRLARLQIFRASACCIRRFSVHRDGWDSLIPMGNIAARVND